MRHIIDCIHGRQGGKRVVPFRVRAEMLPAVEMQQTYAVLERHRIYSLAVKHLVMS